MRSTEELYGILVLATFAIFSMVLAWESFRYRRPKSPAGKRDSH